MAEIFISYRQVERELMRPLADGLRALMVDVWFDERLQPDRSFTEEIEDLLKSCKAQIVCWSPEAVKSEWVRGEADKGRLRGVLVAAMIEPCELPAPFNMHHTENLTGWRGDPTHPGWRKLVDTIGRKLNRAGLGELASLQGSTDSDAWRRWAQRYAEDPCVEGAWKRAEELEVEAARARVAQQRAKVSAKSVVAQSAGPLGNQAASRPQSAPQKRRTLSLSLFFGAALLLVGVAGTLFLVRDRAGVPFQQVAEPGVSTNSNVEPAAVVTPTVAPPVPESTASRSRDTNISEGSVQAANTGPTPVTANGFFTRGNERLRRNEYVGAVADYTESLRLEPSAAAYFNRGLAHYNQRNYPAALADFDQAISRDPNWARPYYYRAQVYYNTHDYGRAVSELDEAIRKDPQQALYFNLRCWTRAVWGVQLDLALNDCNEALRLQPGVASFLDSRGLVRLRRGDFQGAEADYTAALSSAPNQTVSLYGRGLARLRLGRTAEGQADLDAANAASHGVADQFSGWGLEP